MSGSILLSVLSNTNVRFAAFNCHQAILKKTSTSVYISLKSFLCPRGLCEAQIFCCVFLSQLVVMSKSPDELGLVIVLTSIAGLSQKSVCLFFLSDPFTYQLCWLFSNSQGCRVLWWWHGPPSVRRTPEWSTASWAASSLRWMPRAKPLCLWTQGRRRGRCSSTESLSQASVLPLPTVGGASVSLASLCLAHFPPNKQAFVPSDFSLPLWERRGLERRLLLHRSERQLEFQPQVRSVRRPGQREPSVPGSTAEGDAARHVWRHLAHR